MIVDFSRGWKEGAPNGPTHTCGMNLVCRTADNIVVCTLLVRKQVNLDQERGRADRLDRQRQQEDEALSGELRDIMATVGGEKVDSTPLLKNAFANPATGDVGRTEAPSASRGTIGDPTDESTVDTAMKSGAVEDGGSAPPREAGVSGGQRGVANIFAEWGLGRGRGRGGLPDLSQSGAFSWMGGGSGNNARDGGGAPVGNAEGGSTSPPPEGPAEGAAAAQGALRARVVELELQRGEAVEALNATAEQSIRLEVQVRRPFRFLRMGRRTRFVFFVFLTRLCACTLDAV